MPRTLNGPTTWDNVVTSCSPCNAQKAGKALSQLKNMQIRKIPHAPTRSELQRKVRHHRPHASLLRPPRTARNPALSCDPVVHHPWQARSYPPKNLHPDWLDYM